MAGFGGSVKLTGESEYRNALKLCTQSLREMASAQQASAAQFSASDKSTSALTTRQEQLNAILAKQKSVLADVTTAYNNFSAKVQEQADKHKALQSQYDKEVTELERIKAESGETSAAYKAQSEKVADLAAELKKSETAYNQNELALSKMRTQMNTAEATVNKTTKELDELGNAAEEAGEDAKKGGEGFTVMKGILADLGSTAIKGALNGLKSLGGALINVGKQAIASYADYEQLVGGVETLFKDSAGVVEEYANNAYKTAGMSANEYMETVTSFSASLLQSLGGDTAAAAKYGDMAISDMADNANKMGTSMESIQYAYQGFAKQNYTMLDNLKLGYGGTKSEMERLLKDAEKLSGVKYDIGNLADVYDAIHVVQQEMGITGTTAKEAAHTISGSVSSMKSAWHNMLTGIANDNADFGQLVSNLAESILAVASNLVPRIQQTITGIAELVSSLVKDVLPQIVEQIPPILQDTLPILIDALTTLLQSLLDILPIVMPILTDAFMQIVTALIDMLPQIVEVGIQVIVQLIQGITKALPQLIAMLPTIITDIVGTLLDNFDLIIDAGIELILALIDGIIEALPQLIDQIPVIIDKLIDAIVNNFPKILEAGVKLVIKLAEGLIKAIPHLIAAVPKIITSLLTTIANNYIQLFNAGKELLANVISGIGSMLSKAVAKVGEIGTAIWNKIKEFPSKFLEVGKNMVQGLWNGINNAKDWVLGKIAGFGESILSGIKSFFGIASPSKVFRDQIGKNLALGVGEGFSDEMADVTKEMQSALPTSFDTTVSTGVDGVISGVGGLAYDNMVSAFKEALAGVKVVLDDEEMGTFIDRTVTNLVYN